MLIDSILLVCLVMAAWKGYRRGFVVAIFSLAGIFIGLAAALKFSAAVAGWLGTNTQISNAWLPFLSFLLVMVGVIILVRMGAALIQSALELAMMGWLNRISGMILYAALYITVLSVCLFYVHKMQWLKESSFQESHTYAFIEPWGPKLIAAFGKILPFLSGTWEQLTHFFDHVYQAVA
ncbi:MAG TPA: CvpA family protein [Sediminibacterium sp.]|nr:CvpA family protein [Sediminibacterium sp.]